MENDVRSSSRKKRRSAARRTAWALVLALLGHGLFVGVILFLSLIELNLPGRPLRPPPPRAVTFRPLTAEQWAQNRGGQPSQNLPDAKVERPSKPKLESDRPERKEPEPVPKGQVVDVAPGNGEQAPDAKYLAESSNRVDKETRAREQTPMYRNAMPQQTTTTPSPGTGTSSGERRAENGNGGLGTDDRPVREGGASRQVLEIPDIKRQQQVAVKQDPNQAGPGAPVENRTESDEVAGNSERLKIVPGSAEQGTDDASQGRQGTPGVVNLSPSPAVLDKLAGAAPNDRLSEVAEGEGTYLNTKEWKYSSFFNRVKQSVGMHWDPGRELRQRDPTGHIYGGRDRYTLLSVTLDPNGLVKAVQVEKSSGVEFLDLEAVRSFERAQPFPNPPPGLIASDSVVHFSFGFFLEMGGGPRLRLFRQAN